MSLDRFINKEDILSNISVQPNKWTDELNAAQKLGTLALDHQSLFTAGTDLHNIEGHLYSTDGAHIDSAYRLEAGLDPVTGKFGINTKSFVSQLNVKSGNYLAVFNIHQSINQTGNVESPGLRISEISPDRRELIVQADPKSIYYAQFLTSIRISLFANPNFRVALNDGNMVLNCGNGRIATIINISTWNKPDNIAIKLLKPLDVEVGEGTPIWLEKELADPFIKSFIISITPEDTKIYLRSPNFDAESEYNTITETDFQNYTQILGSSTSTSEQIIQTILSGSIPNSPIGVDYSGFQNFVHYSSAAERLANFKYKMQQIEHYDTQAAFLGLATTRTPQLDIDRESAIARKSAIIGSFDGFEKWLYNEPTSSLFTHQQIYDDEHNSGNPTRLEGGLLAADVYQIQPYPKFISSSYGGGEYVNHHTTSSIATLWYNGTLASASLYDELNEDRLLNTVPEHIRLDSNNDQYELFVNMIGHHFDILYSYADALSKTYHPIEHPKLGHTKDTLFNVAKSLGWKLFNGKQASALWQYKLGYSETGSFASTGSIFTKSDEDITTEVWRRIVNNLPYLLKTKGTTRGIKALMNTYGIPQTLLSIREYGGPKVAEDKPLLIEDRFNYALQMRGDAPADQNAEDNGSKIVWGAQYYETNIGTWGYQREGLSSGEEIPPQTREWRFKPAVKKNMLLATIGFGVPKWETNLRPSVHVGLQYTASYSGSDQYGRIIVAHDGSTSAITASTPWVPIYDGEFWNFRWFFESTASLNGQTASDINEAKRFYNAEPNGHGIRYTIQTQKASDYINGKIIHRASASYEHTDAHGTSPHGNWASNNSTYAKQFILGGDSGKGTNYSIYRVGREMSKMYTDGAVTDHFISDNDGVVMTFSGSIQEVREWLEDIGQEAFDLHTLNPTSYVSGKSPTSSFDTLVRHYPLGTDLKAVDHSTHVFVTGSYPASLKFGDLQTPINETTSSLGTYKGNTFASMSKFPTPTNTQRGNYEPVEETYYVQGASLGATLPKSQKIRFDDNELVTRLSPQATAEVSRFDNASLDSNRLGLFYSMADQINKEIFNHIGDVELDDYVGDPDSQYEYEYNDLTHFAKEYWKKYTDRNDVNAFIRMFSQFDFALFESIRQMLPDRIDEAMGLIVEPHILERAKAVPFKQPEQSPHHYDTFLHGLAPSSSGDYMTYEGTMIGTPVLTDSTLPYSPPTGDNGYSDTGNYFGVNILNTSSSTDYFTKHVFPGDERPSITGSILDIYSVIQTEPGFRRHSGRDWQVEHFDRLRHFDNSQPGMDGHFTVVGGDMAGKMHVTDKLRIQIDTYNQTNTLEDVRVVINHFDLAESLGGADLHVRIITTEDNQSADLATISGSVFPFKHITETITKSIPFFATGNTTASRADEFLFKDVHIPRHTNATLELFYNCNSADVFGFGDIRPAIDSVDYIRTISKAGYGALDSFIDNPRPSSIFKKKVLHFHETSNNLTKFRNEELRVISESQHHSLFQYADDGYGSPSKFVYSQSLADTHYRDDFNQKREAKFVGTSISAPGPNVVSGYAELNYEPIVEIFITNPNQVVYNTTPQVTEAGQENPGNLSINAGPTILVQRPFRPNRSQGRPNVSYI